MKYFILFIMFSFLPFSAFPNTTVESGMDIEEVSVEVFELASPDEIELKDCSVTLTGSLNTPIGSISIECKATAGDCHEAVRMATDCVQEAKEAILSCF